MGVYKNKKIEPEFKYLREHQLNIPMCLDVNYFGFHIAASIDTEKKETLIVVNDIGYKLNYYSSVGNMVIIDGTTGDIKFFQAKGYSIRNEDAGNLLRGQRYFGKDPEDTDLDVTGRRFLDLFDQSALSERLLRCLRGRKNKSVIISMKSIKDRLSVTLCPGARQRSKASKGSFADSRCRTSGKPAGRQKRDYQTD